MGALDESVFVPGNIFRLKPRTIGKSIAPVALGVVAVVAIIAGAVLWISAELESKSGNVKSVEAYHKHHIESLVETRRKILEDVSRREFSERLRSAILENDLERLAVIQNELNSILPNVERGDGQHATQAELEAAGALRIFADSVQSEVILAVLMMAEGAPREEVAASVDLDEVSAVAALNTLVTITSDRDSRWIARLDQLAASLSKTGRNSLLLIRKSVV